MKLTEAAIVETALKLVDAVGLDGLTTRRLATELGVRSPSLYHHVASMDVLIDLMAIELMRRHIAELDESGGWQAWLRRFATQGRRMALSCRDGARILTAPVPRNVQREVLADRHALYLMRQGFPHDDAYRTLGLISSFVAGWTLNEQHRHDWLESVMCIDAAFERCLDDVIAGIAHNLAGAVARSQKGLALTAERG